MFPSLMERLSQEVSVFIMGKRSFIFMDSRIENIRICEDITTSNMECLSGQEIMDLNIVISWVELQLDFQITRLPESVNLKNRLGE